MKKLADESFASFFRMLSGKFRGVVNFRSLLYLTILSVEEGLDPPEPLSIPDSSL